MHNRITTTALWVVLSILPFQGSAWAGLDEGYAAYVRGDYATALPEFEPLAEQGDAAAQYNLGVMYASGEGVLQDYAKAVEWYRKAAEQGDVTAQYNLGIIYDTGQGVPQDYAKAALWYRKAAEQGDVIAQNNLGFMHANGRGVPQDYVQAYAWLNIAADQGGADAKKARDWIVPRITPAQLEQAQALSREYFEKYVMPFRSGE